MEQNDKRLMEEMIKQAIGLAFGFQTRKLGDTPTDSYQLTPQKYVNMNGTVASRPVGSIANVGQFYLATDTNIPMFFTTQGTWINGVGSVVALN